MMVYPSSGHEAEPVHQPWSAEAASRIGMRAEQAFLRARAAQRSAVTSLDQSANSQDRTAKAFEDAAEGERREPRRDKYLAYAARHREFAQEDRAMADRLRRIASD
jgi:hypothetical protein